MVKWKVAPKLKAARAASCQWQGAHGAWSLLGLIALLGVGCVPETVPAPETQTYPGAYAASAAGESSEGVPSAVPALSGNAVPRVSVPSAGAAAVGGAGALASAASALQAGAGPSAQAGTPGAFAAGAAGAPKVQPQVGTPMQPAGAAGSGSISNGSGLDPLGTLLNGLLGLGGRAAPSPGSNGNRPDGSGGRAGTSGRRRSEAGTDAADSGNSGRNPDAGIPDDDDRADEPRRRNRRDRDDGARRRDAGEDGPSDTDCETDDDAGACPRR